VLFDLQGDPDQETNAALDKPKVAAEYHQRLLGFLGEIGAPEDVVDVYPAP